MRRVIAQLDPRNAPSARVCERVGMTREAHLREDYWTKGEWADTLIYGLLARERRDRG
jgi:RimJ/RimL family protein N-acetyltransferase